MSKSIYDLKLHQSCVISEIANDGGGVLVFRVPGGWIYQTILGEIGFQTFVPYNEDLKPEQSTQTIDINLTGDKNYGKEQRE